MNALHNTVIAAPRSLANGLRAPLILQREDDDFIGGVLAELSSDATRARLIASRAATRDAGVLKLFQPIQRRFHVALMEAWCETPGTPRIDPRKVDSAGLVLRRVRRRANGTPRYEGWMHGAGKVRGWLPVESLGAADADPRPGLRLAREDTGVADVDRALRALAPMRDAAVLDEQTVPMFVAPPDVCDKAGRTIFYGVVPTTSSERAEGPADTATLFEGFGPESADFVDHLIQPLRGLAYDFPDPGSGRRFTADWSKVLQPAEPGSGTSGALHRFHSLLRQLVVEFDVLGDSAAAARLRAELATIWLPCTPGPGNAARAVVAANFIADAARVLLDGESGTVEMPLSWPARTGAARQRLLQALHGSMLARFQTVTGAPGRFDDTEDRYVLRAFVRLKPDHGCPARTIWSADYSEPFVIAPWYEGGSAPVQIKLPNLADRNVLKAMKPNVSFIVPKALQNLLGGDPQKLLKGEKPGDSTTIGWICSFSIPVITFCAFIVLNLFLSLFDLFFSWLRFVKICLPYPKK